MTIRRALEPADYPFFDYRRFSFALGIAAAGRIWLSGGTAVRHEKPGGMVVRGNLRDQAATVFDKMTATLAAAKRGLADVERIVRYVTPRAVPDLAALDAYQATVLPAGVAVTTIVVTSLLRPEALIEIESVANNGATDGVTVMPSIIAADRASAWNEANRVLGARVPLKAIELGTAAAFDGPAPHARPGGLHIGVPRLVTCDEGVQIDMAVAAPRAIVVHAALEADPAHDGVVNQCRHLYARLGVALAAKGASLASVVKTTEFIVPAALGDYRGTADVRREVFAAPYPAATGVICERLPTAGALIAVEATALTEAG